MTRRILELASAVGGVAFGAALAVGCADCHWLPLAVTCTDAPELAEAEARISETELRLSYTWGRERWEVVYARIATFASDTGTDTGSETGVADCDG